MLGSCPHSFLQARVARVQLHSSLLLQQHTSLEGGTKGFIICSSQPPDKSRQAPPLPPPEGRQASLARRDHWHGELQKGQCPGSGTCHHQLAPSLPRTHCRGCSFMIQSWLVIWWGAHTAAQLRNYWDETCLFKTSDNSLINPVFQKEQCVRDVAFSGVYRLKTENRNDQISILWCGLKHCSSTLNNLPMV